VDSRTRTRVREHLIKRAAEKPAFRQALLADPRQAVKNEFGYEVPENMQLEILEDSPTRVHIVLPPPPPARDAPVTLREITAETVRAVCGLEVKESQRGFVAPNAISIAEAHYAPTAWYRAIYAGETPVGFVMLSDDPEKAVYYLWRYMIDGEFQGLGFGRHALQLVIDYVRGRPGAKELTLSYVPGAGSPRDFYAGLGFQDTGEVHGGEHVMRLTL